MNCMYCNKLVRQNVLNKDTYYFYCKICRSSQLYDRYNNEFMAYEFIFNYNNIIYTYKAFPLLNKSILFFLNKEIKFEYLLNINPSNCISKIKSILLFL
jgi:hypothetical protein